MTDGPTVTVVIPALNPGDMLFSCIDAIKDGPEVELIVIDNGSTDGSPQEAVRRYAELRLVRNEANIGFAAASNMGAGLARGRYLLFLNSDAVLSRRGLARLIRRADEDSEGAIWQPIVLSPNGSVENAGEYFTWSGFFIRRREVGPRRATPYSAFAGTGACLLVRRDVYQAIHGFEVSYFAYIEDIDLCWRARLAGWEVRVVPEVTVIHQKSVTTRRVLQAHEVRLLTFRNRFRTILANSSISSLARIVPAFVAASGGSVVASLASGRLRSAWAMIRALIWPFTHISDVRRERTRAQRLRVKRDRDVFRKDLQARLFTAETFRMAREHYAAWPEVASSGRRR